MLPVEFFDGQAMAKKQAAVKSSKRKSLAVTARSAAPQPKRRDTTKSELATTTAAAASKNMPSAAKPEPAARPHAMRSTLPAEAALSFLRDTKGSVSWSLRDLSQTLNISRGEAERVVALLQIQGYVQPEAHKSGEWITTPAGETVSGAKQPRFERATVEAALTSLKQRIEDVNNDRAAKFRITRAVAFGGFLVKDRARAQAADVGIELTRKGRQQTSNEIVTPHSAVEAREEQEFLRQLRGRSALINLKNYSEWMGTRTHQKLF
jgi:hypothetical protein